MTTGSLRLVPLDRTCSPSAHEASAINESLARLAELGGHPEATQFAVSAETAQILGAQRHLWRRAERPGADLIPPRIRRHLPLLKCAFVWFLTVAAGASIAVIRTGITGISAH